MNESGAPKSNFKPYLWYLIALSMLAYLLNRHVVRSWVQQNVDIGWLVVVVDSFPNFVFSILGTVLIAGMLSSIREHSTGAVSRLTDAKLYLVASLITGLFVVSVELNWHHLMLNNTYDPFDLIASLLGVVIINRLLTRFGLLKYADNTAEPQTD